ncbi:hypothetical protein [Ruminiclostridium cellulolyticum]|uniref:Copper amine oxidase-like N-terminal domain-containing protein n=1 Tax=Ruminiclostridium cellulolyticum (strain ATCC 35319 / DSM 5812 / JCM 6584 / H10) TaxID=394503 RepID=B8I8Z2_RUMCH|nr:hypothetical protein [Ruminiclostridium cellulolyticum]ACL77324.1 hypothetical protein Ccel_3032 [Ruminiclostridium cellulolyticum H10]
MKKFLSGLITGLLVSVSLTAFAAIQLKVVPNPYPVFINNAKANVQGYNINGSTYLKLSDLKTAGLDAKYNNAKKQIEVNSVNNSATDADQISVNPTSDNIDGFKIYKLDGKDYVRIYEIVKYCNDQYIKNQTDKKVFFYLRTKSIYSESDTNYKGQTPTVESTMFYIEKHDLSVHPRVITTVDLFSVKLTNGRIDINVFKEYFQPIVNLSLEDVYNSKSK